MDGGYGERDFNLVIPFFLRVNNTHMVQNNHKTKHRNKQEQQKHRPQWFKSLHSSNGKQNLYRQICTTPESKWWESIILPYLTLTKQHCYFPLDPGKQALLTRSPLCVSLNEQLTIIVALLQDATRQAMERTTRIK